MAFVAGAYTAYYGKYNDSGLLGITEDGFDLEMNFSSEEITGDNLGDSVQDIVYRGGNCFISCVLEEWNPAILSMFSSAAGSPGGWDGVFGHMGMIGRLGRYTPKDLENRLLLASTAGSASVASPAALLARIAVIAPGFSSRINFNSRLRKIPLRFQLLPYVADGATKWFEMTGD